MEHIFKMNVGDYSDDGHGKNEVIVIKSTKSVQDVVNAFLNSGRKLGVVEGDDMYPNFLIAKNYEDTSLSTEFAEAFRNAGIEFEDLTFNDADEDEEPEYHINGTHEIVHLVMRIAQKELDFEYEIDNKSIPSFNGFDGVGPQIGYGLFW